MNITGWIGAIVALVGLASVLGASVAVYKTSVYSTSLREARATSDDLRAEVEDEKRRRAQAEADHLAKEHAYEAKLAAQESEMTLSKQSLGSCQDRIKVLEDLLTKRADDQQILQDLAATRALVEQSVLSELRTIRASLEKKS